MNTWGNVTSHPHLCPQMPPQPHGPLPSAVMSHTVFSVTCAPACLLSLMSHLYCVLCYTCNEQEDAWGSLSSDTSTVCSSSKPRPAPVQGPDTRRPSTTAGPRRLVLLPLGHAPLFWLLLHRNAQPSWCAQAPALAQCALASFADQLLGLRSFIPVPGRLWLCILCKHILTSSDHMTGTSAA